MPKRRIDISAFRNGSLPAADELDVGPEQAAFAKNVDLATRPGVVRGLPTNGSNTEIAKDGPVVSAFILEDRAYWYTQNSGDWVEHELDSNIIGAFTNIDEQANVSNPVSHEASVVGESARIPQDTTPAVYLGPIDVEHVHEAVLSDIPPTYMTQAPLRAPLGDNVSITGTTASGSDDNFTSGTRYHFFASWLYDGYQEGPLLDLDTSWTASSQSKVDLSLDWTQSQQKRSPARAGALLLYAMPDPSQSSSPPENQPIEFIGRIPVDDEDWTDPTQTSSKTSVKDDNDWSGSFEAQESEKDLRSGPSTRKSVTNTATVTAGDLSNDPIQRLEVDYSISITVNGDAQTSTGAVTVDAAGTVKTDAETSSTDTTVSGTITHTGLSLSGGDTISIDVTADPQVDDTATNSYVSVTTQINAVRIETSTGSGRYTSDYVFTWKGSFGNTYADRTGIARPVAEDQIDRYDYSLTAGPYHVVAGVEIDQQLGANRQFDPRTFLVRSKAHRPDMFDWTNDFVDIGQTITGLASHETVVAVFGDTDTFIVDEQEWRIIDRLPNVTAFHSDAAVTTPFGLVFCDEDGVYMWRRGEGYRLLSRAIGERNSGPQYVGDVTSSSFDGIAYIPAVNMVCLFYNGAAGWAYYMPTPSRTDQRPQPYWTHLNESVLSVDDLYALRGHKGTVYTVHEDDNNTGNTALFEGSNRVPWRWQTAAFAPQGATQRWVPYEAYLIPDSFSGSLSFKEDDGSFVSGSGITGDTAWTINTAENNGNAPPWAHVERLQLEVDGSGGDVLEALGITYRLLRPTTTA